MLAVRHRDGLCPDSLFDGRRTDVCYPRVGPVYFRLLARLRRLLGDAVSDAGRVLDDVRFSELAAQAADRDADGVGERVGVLIPGLLEQSFCAERAGAGPEQRFEHGELFGGEVELSAVAGGGTGERVELDSLRR